MIRAVGKTNKAITRARLVYMVKRTYPRKHVFDTTKVSPIFI